jgi:hypothetical protein
MSVPSTCNWCSKINSHTKKCGKCFLVSYCDTACQTAHWRDRHRVECAGPPSPKCRSDQAHALHASTSKRKCRVADCASEAVTGGDVRKTEHETLCVLHASLYHPPIVKSYQECDICNLPVGRKRLEELLSLCGRCAKGVAEEICDYFGADSPASADVFRVSTRGSPTCPSILKRVTTRDAFGAPLEAKCRDCGRLSTTCSAPDGGAGDVCAECRHYALVVDGNMDYAPSFADRFPTKCPCCSEWRLSCNKIPESICGECHMIASYMRHVPLPRHEGKAPFSEDEWNSICDRILRRTRT